MEPVQCGGRAAESVRCGGWGGWRLVRERTVAIDVVGELVGLHVPTVITPAS